MCSLRTSNTQAVDSLPAALSTLAAIRPIAVLDGCLNALSKLPQLRSSLKPKEFDERKNQLLDLFCRAAAVAAGCEDAQTVSDPAECLFSKAQGSLKRKEIAVFFVRLLRSYPDVVNSPHISFRCFELIDDSLADSVYHLAKLDPHAQNFEKASAIGDLLHSTEKKLDSLVASLTTIDSIEAFRTQYLKQMNSGATRLLIHPFILKNLRDGDLQAVLNDVSDYARAVGPESLTTYRSAQSHIAEYVEACRSFGSDYAIRFCGAIGERLRQLVWKHFEATPFSRPAALTISPSPKKYPLRSVGQSIPISIVVKNSSDGVALEVRISIRTATDDLECSSLPLQIGGLEPGESRVELSATVRNPSSSALLEILVEWKNADDTANEISDIVEIFSQREDVDWETARTSDPYSLSPVSTFAVLVGRDSIIDSLLALTTNADVGSAFIRGQKRVGKTSIAKTLQTRLQELYPGDYVVVYLEAGDYITPDGTSTIQALGRQLCRNIKRSKKEFSDLPLPNFVDALSPLTEYLEDVTDRLPHCRILFILDEFDELPLNLYKRGALGDAFFRTIRSISSKPQFGFVLVGSEKMEYVLSNQGDSLNKFVKIPVDYFDKEFSWNAFVELVRRPAAAHLEYSDSAVASIHSFSAGNPFFAKWICRSIYGEMIAKRDSHVTELEVTRGVNKTLSEMGTHSVQYFWQDGIIDPPPQAEEIAVRRAKLLLSLTECVRHGEIPTSDAIADRAKGFGLDQHVVEHDLRSFERRKVLENRNGAYGCKVRLFQDWLVSQGYYQILTTFVDNEGLSQALRHEEALRIKDDEMLALADKWDLFLARRISDQQIRSWLGQFVTIEERRLMFSVLQSLRFYSADQIRAKVHEIHGIVTRGTTWHRKHRETMKRRDVIVTYLDGPGHSGAEYARRYGDENQIYPDNICALNQVQELLTKRPDIKGVVMPDDFIGTGKTLSGLISTHSEELRSISGSVDEKVFLVVLCGIETGISAVQNVIDQKDLRIRLHVLDTLKPTEGVFGGNSPAFNSETERNRARDVAYKYGLELLPEWPLGYGGSEATVVFENKIPNNCLPILWVARKGWRPLFRRL